MTAWEVLECKGFVDICPIGIPVLLLLNHMHSGVSSSILMHWKAMLLYSMNIHPVVDHVTRKICVCSSFIILLIWKYVIIIIKVWVLQSVHVVKCMCCKVQKIRCLAIKIISYTFHFTHCILCIACETLQ